MSKAILVIGLMISAVMADPGVSMPTIKPFTSVKMADGDVMRMMADWKRSEKDIATMQSQKADPQQIIVFKRQNNDLKRKIEDQTKGNVILEKAWAKVLNDIKAVRDHQGLVKHPADELAQRRANVAKFFDDQLKELDAQLRVAEQNKAKRLQEIGIAGIQGTMDESTKQRERESAIKSFEDFIVYTDSERSRLEDEKAQTLAKIN